jgi:hypothetical protein
VEKADMKAKHHLMVASGSLLCLLGCGSDREAELKQEELKAKVIQLDVELRELKKSHQAELDALKKVVDHHSDQYSKMDHETDVYAGKTIVPSRIPEPAFTQEQIRTRDAMRAEARQIQENQLATRDESRSVAMIRQLYLTRSAAEVSTFLNEKHISNNTGGLWTEAEVQAMVNKYKMEKSPAK